MSLSTLRNGMLRFRSNNMDEAGPDLRSNIYMWWCCVELCCIECVDTMARDRFKCWFYVLWNNGFGQVVRNGCNDCLSN